MVYSFGKYIPSSLDSSYQISDLAILHDLVEKSYKSAIEDAGRNKTTESYANFQQTEIN